MSLMIVHLESRPKNWSKPERHPVLILLAADEPDVTPDLATVFRAECEALFPEILERTGLKPQTRLTWSPHMVGSRACLTGNDHSYFDVYVTIGVQE